MLAKRIIPCLDVKAGRVVKGTNFVFLRDAGDPVELAAQYEREQADELTFLDITASVEGRKAMLDVIERTAREVFMPLTVGGGISTMEDIRAVLMAGADKTSLNTAAVMTPELIQKGAEAYGAQCMVIADPGMNKTSSAWEGSNEGGGAAPGVDVLEWVRKAVTLGAGEILLTSMDADGTQDGFDLDLTRAVAEEVPVPVIASGGAGKLEDFYRVLTEGKADAALAASVFHYGTFRIKEVKDYLSRRGVVVRR